MKQLLLALTAIACFGAYTVSMVPTADAKSLPPAPKKCENYPKPPKYKK